MNLQALISPLGKAIGDSRFKRRLVGWLSCWELEKGEGQVVGKDSSSSGMLFYRSSLTRRSIACTTIMPSRRLPISQRHHRPPSRSPLSSFCYWSGSSLPPTIGSHHSPTDAPPILRNSDFTASTHVVCQKV